MLVRHERRSTARTRVLAWIGQPLKVRRYNLAIAQFVPRLMAERDNVWSMSVTLSVPEEVPVTTVRVRVAAVKRTEALCWSSNASIQSMRTLQSRRIVLRKYNSRCAPIDWLQKFVCQMTRSQRGSGSLRFSITQLRTQQELLASARQCQTESTVSGPVDSLTSVLS